jgi:hypothetical protein
MEKARGVTGGMGQQSAASQIHIRRLGFEIAEVAGVSPRMTAGLLQAAQGTRVLAGAMMVLNRAALPLLIIFTAIEAAKFLGVWDALQDRIGLSTKRFEELVKVHEKFNTELTAFQSSQREFTKERITADTAIAVSARTAAGDVLGAEREKLAGSLVLLGIEKAARSSEAREKFKDETLQRLALQDLDRTHLAKLLAARAEFVAKSIELTKTRFLQETTLALDAVKRQIEAREKFTAATQAAAGRQDVGGTILTGFGKIEDLRRDAAQLAAGFRDLEQRGTPLSTLFPDIERTSAALVARVQALNEEFRDSPAVLTLLDQKLRGLALGDFSTLITGGTVALRGFETTGGSTAASISALASRLTTELPAGVNIADGEIRRLRGTLADLQAQVDATTGSVIGLVDALASSASAPVSRPTLPNTGIRVVEE